jgi:thiamine pyrophosphate-dependent acetolactate synthase large subunit-like protein
MISRREATIIAAELAGRNPIVSSVGNPTFDLFAVADRPRNFYIWNSMGMASSIALGLALAKPDQRIVVLDGDGALLMNLGSLATMMMAGVSNLVHVGLGQRRLGDHWRSAGRHLLRRGPGNHRPRGRLSAHGYRRGPGYLP